MKLLIGNIKTQIEYSETPEFQNYFNKIIHESMDPLDPNRYNIAAFVKWHKWDGRREVTDLNNHIIPTGLLPQLIRLIKAEQAVTPELKLELEDTRTEPVKLSQPLPEKVELHDDKLGSIVLRDYQRESVIQAFDKQRITLGMATGAGKCITKDTWMLTEKGYVQLQDLFKEQGITLDSEERVVEPSGNLSFVNKKGELEKVGAYTVNGDKPVLKITTEFGHEETMTLNHPVAFINSKGETSWKKSGSLKVGDTIVSRINTQQFNSIGFLDTESAYLIGLLLADGYLNQKDTWKISNNQEAIIKRVKQFFKTRYDYEVNFRSNLRSAGAGDLEIFDNKIVNKLRKVWELPQVIAKDKQVPSVIMSSPKDVQLAFLSGFLECECSLNSSKKATMEVTSASKKLLHSLQLMLDNLGIVSKITTKMVKAYPDTYYGRLTINGLWLQKLLPNLNFITLQRKEQKTGVLNKKLFPFDRMTIPNSQQLLKEYAKGTLLPKHPFNTNHNSGKTRVSNLIAQYPNGNREAKIQLEYLADPNLRFEKIVSIEDAGIQSTYDISMPETHSFIANGIINHNTEVASTIIKYGLPEIKDDERILFLVGSKNIAHQSQERISQRIEHEVGFWGDGKKDIKQITVGMSGTLASALKDPEKDIKLTSQKDKVLKHFAQDYAPQFVNKPNIKQTIRAYLKNNPPKYSYDEEIQTTLASWVSDPQVSQKELSDALWWQVNAFHDLLRKKNQKAYDKYEEAVNFLESVKIVIGDEQQHSVSESYTLIYDHLINARMNIGLTGTPPKGDPVKEQKFKAIMGEEIYRVSNDELITRGVSAKPTIQMVPVTEPKDLDAEIVLQMPQDTPEKQQGLMSYQLAYQLGVVNNEVRNKTIAGIVKKLADSKSGSTLIVVNSVEHGEIIKGYLDEMGIDTYFMQGSSSTEERNDMINKAKTGKLDVLIGTQVVDEGLDIPSLKYLIYASAGKSSRQLLQRIGRMLRKSDTKNTTVIFDIEDRTADILFKQAKTRIRLYKSEKFTVNEV